MKDTLNVGQRHTFAYMVPREKTVPFVYREAEDFQAMPEVFATGYMVALMEWGAVQLLKPHLDEGEGSVGTHIDIAHLAATPPGHTVTVEVEVTRIDGRRIWFRVSAHDGDDLIGEGRHERAVVVWDKFNARVAQKAGARQTAD